MSKEIHLKPVPIAQLPYAQRQLIIVVPDKVVEAERSAKAEEDAAKEGIDWQKAAKKTLSVVTAIGTIEMGATALIAAAGIEAIKAIGRLRESGLSVLTVGQSDADKLHFPPGHPRDGILYIGHPGIPSVYYTTAQFHRLTFEHKFAEAIDLLMGLGAKTISVEYQSGWGNEFAGQISAPILATAGGANASATAGAKSNSTTHLLFTASLNPKKAPALPSNPVWLHHESTWQKIAKGRLEHGLKNFSLLLRYEDDFGVNAGLKLTASKAGLDLGGKFEDHVATVWRLEGTFAEEVSRDTVSQCGAHD